MSHSKMLWDKHLGVLSSSMILVSNGKMLSPPSGMRDTRHSLVGMSRHTQRMTSLLSVT